MSNKKKTGFTQLDKFNIGYVQASFLSTVEIIVFSKIKALKVKNKTKLLTGKQINIGYVHAYCFSLNFCLVDESKYLFSI